MQRGIQLEQARSLPRDPIAIGPDIDDAGGTQRGEALFDHRGPDPAAARLEVAEGQRRGAQLPDHSQGPAPAEQVEQRHDRDAPAGTTDRTARTRDVVHPSPFSLTICASVSEALASLLRIPKQEDTGCRTWNRGSARWSRPST